MKTRLLPSPTPIHIPITQPQTTHPIIPILLTSLKRSNAYQVRQFLDGYPFAFADTITQVLSSPLFTLATIPHYPQRQIQVSPTPLSNQMLSLHPLSRKQLHNTSKLHNTLAFPISTHHRPPIHPLSHTCISPVLSSTKEQHLGTVHLFNFPPATPVFSKPFPSMSLELREFIHSTQPFCPLHLNPSSSLY